MNYIIRRPWDLPESRHTAIEVYRNRRSHRREFLKSMGLGAAGAAFAPLVTGCSSPTDEEIEAAGQVEPLPTAYQSLYPAERNPEFEYGRDETAKRAAAEYSNFYEFTTGKDVYRYVAGFNKFPETLTVDGLCEKPREFDLDDLLQLFTLEERAYRHRCVETWAMCVPWTGFPLRDLLKEVQPKPGAKFVEFQTFQHPDTVGDSYYDWPYTEGLTIAEADNELSLLATGIFGEPLPKQHGTPVRLVVPWKYGYKSIKSLTRITFTDRQPATFWNTADPREYDFQANVNPDIPHPRWSQATEWMLGTRERFETQIYNGYGEYVAGLYA
ncbi:MAG: protein-methionine-sulfoxide reductase catalytic subunit MsrP [Planctomycetota bacterium]|mgnify:CR=1 FL=1|nr:MAG: protein-methionine-sulfoxide reductase catalytic subunit MsrP [Planctomycetota bacterium]REJ93767.1 MAG: protein-methionine-sulfoxide reductase catalytic subunit MsrP [Planctomycetota bacterium]REK20326.1 MAG: protein-methionine-sulfoxide reductase catalytic subunit MsrP [Planctomycetota bacterium]REK26823.1 MAG: protein-methionine-sulfoxide reductase catalytic subunit MsrP [Planctomycetota bacterium]